MSRVEHPSPSKYEKYLDGLPVFSLLTLRKGPGSTSYLPGSLIIYLTFKNKKSPGLEGI